MLFIFPPARAQARIVPSDCRKPLTVDDAEAIQAQASAVEEVAIVAPNVGYSGGPFDDNITYQGHNYRWGNTQGVSPNYADITTSRSRKAASSPSWTISSGPM